MDIPGFLLDAQRDMLLAAIADGAADATARRQAVTRSLTASLVRLTEALAPPVVVEIGAHEAEFSRALAKTLPASRIVAFEAHPRVHARHSQGCATAGIEYRNACVTDAEGRATLKTPLRDNGSERLMMGSLLADGRAEQMQEHDVEAVTLDGALGDDAGRPNVLWIDVEGAARQVLAGATRTLAASLAVYIEVEATPRWEGQILAPEVSERLAPYGLWPVLRDVQRESGGRDWQYNVLYLSERTIGD
jgi:FkbM family methyltransferase